MNILSKEVIQEWGLGGLDEIKQVEVVERIGRLLYQAILVQSLDILSDKEQDELDAILAKDDATPQTVLDFLRTKIPTFETLLREEQDKLKAELLIPAA